MLQPTRRRPRAWPAKSHGSFVIGSDDLRVVRLTASDAERLQPLYEACADYTLLVEGAAPASTAALDDLIGLPPGKAIEDKYVFGLIDPSGRVVGMIESVRGFPDPGVWWLGLLLVDPQRRRGGLGPAFCSGFERWVADHGYQRIDLGVVGANASALSFWQRQGFHHLRTAPDQVFGRLTHDVLVMSKNIS